MKKVLIAIGKCKKIMAVNITRLLETAIDLKEEHDVTVWIDEYKNNENFKIVKDDNEIKNQISNYDVIITSEITYNNNPFIKKSKVPVIMDLYSVFEYDYRNKELKEKSEKKVDSKNLRLKVLKGSDFFLACSENEKNYDIGLLSVSNRINPIIYRENCNIDNIIGINEIKFRVSIFEENFDNEYSNIKDKKIVLLEIDYNFTKYKDIIKELEIVNENKDFHYVIFLSGTVQMSKIKSFDAKEYILSSKIKNNVTFIDYNERKISYFAKMCKMGMSLNYRTLNYSIRYSYLERELLRNNKPIIAYKDTAISRYVEKYDIGIVISNYNQIGKIQDINEDKYIENIENFKNILNEKQNENLKEFVQNARIASDKHYKELDYDKYKNKINYFGAFMFYLKKAKKLFTK